MDSLERDQPGRGHWVLRVGISRVILKFLGEEIDNFLLLEIYERQVVRQSDPVLVDLCGCLSDSTWEMGRASKHCFRICRYGVDKIFFNLTIPQLTYCGIFGHSGNFHHTLLSEFDSNLSVSRREDDTSGFAPRNVINQTIWLLSFGSCLITGITKDQDRLTCGVLIQEVSEPAFLCPHFLPQGL